MKKLLKQILSELQAIRKALEPEITTLTQPGVNNHRKPYIISRLIGTINLGVYDTTTQKCIYTGTKEECKKWIDDQKPNLPESVDEMEKGIVSLPGVILSKGFQALAKLYVLRQAYWQAEGWEPELDPHIKDAILIAEGKPYIGQILTFSRFLSFKANTGQAEHFLKHHRALIEQARELL